MSPVRASDEERQWFIELLERHFVEGRIDHEEFTLRIERAVNAQTLEELYGLISDLPHLPTVVMPYDHTYRRSRRSFGAMVGRWMIWWRRRSGSSSL
jgi:hypothetical protein